MTRQVLTIHSPIRVSDSQSQQLQTQSFQAQEAEAAAVDQQRSRLIEAMKSQYQLDQQVEFLHLQAEADSLLQQLQALKEQRASVRRPIVSVVNCQHDSCNTLPKTDFISPS